MGPLGFNEIIILGVILVLLIILPMIFIYRYGKQKGRLQEMERQARDRKSQNS